MEHNATRHVEHNATRHVEHNATRHVEHNATRHVEHNATRHVEHNATRHVEHNAARHVEHNATRHVEHNTTSSASGIPAMPQSHAGFQIENQDTLKSYSESQQTNPNSDEECRFPPTGYNISSPHICTYNVCCM